jgi:hypothetical protein
MPQTMYVSSYFLDLSVCARAFLALERAATIYRGSSFQLGQWSLWRKHTIYLRAPARPGLPSSSQAKVLKTDRKLRKASPHVVIGKRESDLGRAQHAAAGLRALLHGGSEDALCYVFRHGV